MKADLLIVVLVGNTLSGKFPSNPSQSCFSWPFYILFESMVIFLDMIISKIFQGEKKTMQTELEFEWSGLDVKFHKNGNCR